jgi:hypothetical protein
MRKKKQKTRPWQFFVFLKYERFVFINLKMIRVKCVALGLCWMFHFGDCNVEFSYSKLNDAQTNLFFVSSK